MTIEPIYLAPILVLGFGTAGYVLFVITDPRTRQADPVKDGFEPSEKKSAAPTSPIGRSVKRKML